MAHHDLRSFIPYLGIIQTGDLGPYTFYTAKDRGVVFFPRSPPRKPWSTLQLNQRARWTIAARQWSSLPLASRHLWQLAATRAHLRIAGFHLYMHAATTASSFYLRTIERTASVQLPFTAPYRQPAYNHAR